MHRSKKERYSITSSASCNTGCGIVNPRVFALLRLKTIGVQGSERAGWIFRCWHKASEMDFKIHVRFRGTAEMDQHPPLTASDANDPRRTLASLMFGSVKLHQNFAILHSVSKLR
jgi:hypothetical protein